MLRQKGNQLKPAGFFRLSLLFAMTVPFACVSARGQASADTEAGPGDGGEPCHVEEFVQNRQQEGNKPPMAPEALALLPYFIYADQYHLRKGDGKGLTMDDCLKMEAEYERVPPKQHRSGGHDWVIDMFGSEYYLAETIKGYVLEHAILAYNAKYGNVDMPTIARDEIADYERRANSGDVAAMRELRRYYEFPDPGSYNPEQAESRYWLSREIAAGDEGAMLEAGYGRPYSVRTELVYDGTSVAMDVACEGIVGQDGAPYPACFLYNLLIGDNPARVGHLVLDQDHLSGLSVRPQIIALRMAGGR